MNWSLRKKSTWQHKQCVHFFDASPKNDYFSLINDQGIVYEDTVCAEPYNGLDDYFIHDGTTFWAIMQSTALNIAAVKTPNNIVDITASWGESPISDGDCGCVCGGPYEGEEDCDEIAVPTALPDEEIAGVHFLAYFGKFIWSSALNHLTAFSSAYSPYAAPSYEIFNEINHYCPKQLFS